MHSLCRLIRRFISPACLALAACGMLLAVAACGSSNSGNSGVVAVQPLEFNGVDYCVYYADPILECGPTSAEYAAYGSYYGTRYYQAVSPFGYVDSGTSLADLAWSYFLYNGPSYYDTSYYETTYIGHSKTVTVSTYTTSWTSYGKTRATDSSEYSSLFSGKSSKYRQTTITPKTKLKSGYGTYTGSTGSGTSGSKSTSKPALTNQHSNDCGDAEYMAVVQEKSGGSSSSKSGSSRGGSSSSKSKSTTGKSGGGCE